MSRLELGLAGVLLAQNSPALGWAVPGPALPSVMPVPAGLLPN